MSEVRAIKNPMFDFFSGGMTYSQKVAKEF